MRATQVYIDENFGNLFEKISAFNPELVDLIRTKDPELQYKILREIDKFEEKLFVVAIDAATEEWLDRLIDQIGYVKIFPSAYNMYDMAGFTPEEVERISNNERNSKSLHEEIVETGSNIIDKGKTFITRHKKIILYGFAMTGSYLFGVLIGQKSK